MNTDSLLEIVAACISDPSFVGMTKSVGDDKARFCHAEERSI